MDAEGGRWKRFESGDGTQNGGSCGQVHEHACKQNRVIKQKRNIRFVHASVGMFTTLSALHVAVSLPLTAVAPAAHRTVQLVFGANKVPGWQVAPSTSGLKVLPYGTKHPALGMGSQQDVWVQPKGSVQVLWYCTWYPLGQTKRLFSSAVHVDAEVCVKRKIVRGQERGTPTGFVASASTNASVG